MKKRIMIPFLLNIFDGEGGGGNGGGAAEGAEATANVNTEATEANVTAKKGKKSRNALSDVQYGKASPAAETGSMAVENTEPPKNTEDKRRADFEQFLKDNKDLDTERVQGIINKRFAETKNLEEQLQGYQPILEMLKSKYGTDDLSAITEAMQDDDELVRDRARENGLTIEQQKQMDDYERRLAKAEKDEAERQKEQRKNEIQQQWMQDSEKLKQIYPNFDLASEINNMETGDRFKSLISRGIDIGTAYEIVHKDEIMQNMRLSTAQNVQRAIVNDIKARGQRPAENGGMANAPSVISKPDPSKWSKEDRAEVSRRVMRGEKIYL